jgi:DNA polymerase-3 subunit epsilon
MIGRRGLERKLLVGVVVLFLVPTVVAVSVLYVLYLRDVFESPTGLALTAVIGLVALAVYLTSTAHVIGRSLVRTIQEIQRGTELMATVHADHRIQVRTGDELEALAADVNRMADRMQEARANLRAEVDRATRALSAERARLSAVLSELVEGVAVATLDGVVVLCNPAAQTLLGAASDRVIGRSLTELLDPERVGAALTRIRAGQSREERFTVYSPTGAIVRVGVSPFRDEWGREAGIILALLDVTGPVRDHADLQRMISRARRELRRRVASVRMLSERLVEESVEREGPARGLAESVHAEVLRLVGFLAARDAPDRIGFTRAPWHFEEIPVDDLIGAAVRRLAPAEGEAEGGVVVAPGDGLPPLRGEMSTLSVALVHVLGALRARAPAGTLRVAPARRGDVVQIEAMAMSIGIPAAELDRELDMPVALGVAGRLTVREIVHDHAGQVWAFADRGGVGVRFTFPAEWPREPGPAAPAALARAPFVGAGTRSGVSEGEDVAPRPGLYDFSFMDDVERYLVPADRERPLADLTYTVFDTETTGLRPEAGDRIISMGAARVRGGSVRSGETFDAIVRPGRPIPEASVRFHGITDAMAADAPPIEVVLPAFLRFAAGTVLVGHEVWFDLDFLAPEVKRLGLPLLAVGHPILDTRLLSLLVHGPGVEHDLDSVAARLGVAVRGRHSALGDALTTAEILERLLPLLNRRGIVTLGQALAAVERIKR